ncbi:hypothetical protein [Leclercia adecarboxylata]|uniref:hypothetical protein n=1 Tax=Leclercia adecarboxylata TaxID=83655 RepID=UPI002B31896F|nr:hypothetical protein NRF19_18980 [Leclercia adecarboxylata]
MSKTPRLTLENTFLYDQNDVCIRYEIYSDKNNDPRNVVMILVIQEDEKSRIIVEKIHPNAQTQQSSGIQQQVGTMFNPGPLQVTNAEGYCSKHFDKSYS